MHGVKELIFFALNGRSAARRAIPALMAWSWLVGGGMPPSAAAQIIVQVEGDETAGAQDPLAAVLHPSEEASTLLARARQGIEREDWKLVVDSLQRIVELPGEHVLTSDGRLYESARRHAHRRIAALPPAGLAAYRLMYDSEAAALMAKAVEAHDLDLLRSIVSRYLVTRSGDDAGVTLADWLIDEGRFAEAVAVLQLIKSIYPDSDLPAWTVPSRLAVCYAGMGRRQRAETLLAEVKDAQPSQMRERIQAYIERPIKDPEVADETSSWPLAYGRPSREGVMPFVEPSFDDHAPWLVPLNLGEDISGVEEYARAQQLLPTASMVADGRLLVVKSGPALQALDVDTFEVVWQRDPGAAQQESAIVEEPDQAAMNWQQRGMQSERADQLENRAVVRQLLRDSVGSGLAIVQDLVLTVEWMGEPPNTSMMRQHMGWPGVSGAVATHPNRIVAYSLADGKVVWESSTRPGQNRLGLVEFLSAPVPVDGLLLAPCRVNTDLYAVLLDPADGRIVRHIYLCGTGGGPFDSLYALQPCVADGVVFIPTGRGVVVALETAGWSIRWVVRYDTHHTPARGESGWLPTPAIAVADSVLVAPADADYLYCLDRATGEIRWGVERGNSQYVAGATDRHVWLGGSEAQLINVETGEVVWHALVKTPTGRGVVAGDRMYLPTIEGLIALDAMTGESIELPQDVGQPITMGNLLAWNNTLYSTDTAVTREFPDMERGYAEALRRHQANPEEPSNAIRLARLEMLRQSPAKALAALKQLPAGLESSHPRRFEQVNHLKVLSMLELAASGDVSSEEARRLLEEARRIAVSAQDAVDSALALGDYHRRESRPLEACLQYLALALSREGDQIVTESDEFRRRARSVAVQRLVDVARELSDEQKVRLDEAVRRWLSQAESKRNVEGMRWLAESTGIGPAVGEAGLILGRWAAEDLRFEQAEGFFQRVIRESQSPALQAEATARLAAIYLEPADLHLPVWASALLDRLEHEFASVEVPVDVLANGEGGMVTTRPATDHLPGARIARELRRRMDSDVLARHRTAMGPIALSPLREPRTSSGPGVRPLLVREGRIEPLAEQQMVLVEGNKVEAWRADDGTVLWPAELRLLNELAVESQVESNWMERNAMLRQGQSPVAPARGLVDGQTLVVNSAYGIHAIGLLTGRRLWSRRFDPPVLRSQQEPSGSDAWLWVHDGYVMSVDKSGTLEVSRITAGDRLLWSRKRAGRRWYAVRARGEYVVAVDDKLEQVDVFRLDDGRYLGACHFKQNPSARVNITLFEDVICGPGANDEVIALELATPGVERWRVRTVSNLAQLFKPSSDLLAVSDRVGNVRLIDPRTGKPYMPDVRVSACRDGVTDGTLKDGMLYVCGYEKRSSGAGDFDSRRWGLAAIRVRDGAVAWEREGFGPRTHLDQDVLECAPNAIPVAVLTLENEANRQFHGGVQPASSAKLEVTLLDKQTGQEIGRTISATIGAEAGASWIMSVEVYPGQLQVTAGTARLRFPFEQLPGRKPAGTGSRPAEDAGGPAAELDAGKGSEGGAR